MLSHLGLIFTVSSTIFDDILRPAYDPIVMNILHIFTTLLVVLTHFRKTNDHFALAPFLDAPEFDTTYSICYIFTPPSVPLTIDPSPPVLAPPFDPGLAPIPHHTFKGATSAGYNYGEDKPSVDWMINFSVVMVSLLLVHVNIL